MANHHLFLLSLLALAPLQVSYAVIYEVTNTVAGPPGGVRFDREIGVAYTKQIMGPINKFIWDIFQEPTPADRRNIQHVKVLISEFTGVVAYTNGEVINVSSPFIQTFQGNLKSFFTGLMYHEMTHIFQWSGNFTAPGGLTEGFAEYVMMKAGYSRPGVAQPGQGDRWDQGYDVTARFLEYCDSLKRGFAPALNKKMRYGYSDNYFAELLGKPVGQLWSEYKAKYRHQLIILSTVD